MNIGYNSLLTFCHSNC